MKIIEYDVISERYESDFKSKVNGAIKKGWQPMGSIILQTIKYQDSSDNFDILIQAMVKYEEGAASTCKTRVDGEGGL